MFSPTLCAGCNQPLRREENRYFYEATGDLYHAGPIKECRPPAVLAWSKIPEYALGETPEALPDESPPLYRRIIAKRALLAAYEEEGPDTMITDLLADLRHLCDALGLDFAKLDRVAHMHYSEEVYEGRKENEHP